MSKIAIITLFLINILSAAEYFTVKEARYSLPTKENIKPSTSYILDCGTQDKFLNIGTKFTVFRKSNAGDFNLVGYVETYSVSDSLSLSRSVAVSETLEERMMGIENIAVGDFALPTVTFNSTEIFQNVSSSTISGEGVGLIQKRMLPLLNSESFSKLVIVSYLDRLNDSQTEVIMSKNQGEAVKKHLMVNYGIPEGFIEIKAIGNYQNMYAKNMILKNAHIDFMFIPEEPQDILTPETPDDFFDDIPSFEPDFDVDLKEPTEIQGPGLDQQPSEQ